MGSTKNNLISFRAIQDGDMSADINGPATNIAWMDNVSVHIQIGAGATGEFFIQGSNVSTHSGVAGNGPGPNDWVTVPFVDSSGTPVSLTCTGSAVSYLCNASGLAFTYLRVIYDFTSGTGTAQAWVTGKSI